MEEGDGMKDIVKGMAVKILSIIVAAALLCGGGYILYQRFLSGMLDEAEHETVDNVEIVKEKLEAAAELNTGSYLCTDVLTRSDSKKFRDWEIPFTEKSFIISYDGTVKAGIKDLTKAQVTQSENTIIVKIPEVEITGAEIDNDSFEKLDESSSIFNPISVEDLNDAQKELKENMIERAMEKGILDMAKSNAETVISGMLASPTAEYDIKIEWQ